MLVALLGTIINIILDYVLVYGIHNYINPMNIKGAAYASVIAQISMAILSGVFLIKKTNISLKIKMPFSKEIFKFISMVLNLFVRTLAVNIALYFATSFSTSYGKEYIAAYSIGLNLWLMGAFMIDGYSSVGNILSGKLLGAKSYKSLLKLQEKLTVYGFLFGICLSIVGFIFYKYIGKLFTQDILVLEQFQNTFWIILLMQPICSITFIFDGMYKGMGETKYLRNVLLVSTSFVFILFLLILDCLDYKLYGIWISFFCWVIARGLPLVLRFRKQITALSESK